MKPALVIVGVLEDNCRGRSGKTGEEGRVVPPVRDFVRTGGGISIPDIFACNSFGGEGYDRTRKSSMSATKTLSSQTAETRQWDR